MDNFEFIVWPASASYCMQNTNWKSLTLLTCNLSWLHLQSAIHDFKNLKQEFEEIGLFKTKKYVASNLFAQTSNLFKRREKFRRVSVQWVKKPAKSVCTLKNENFRWSKSSKKSFWFIYSMVWFFWKLSPLQFTAPLRMR